MTIAALSSGRRSRTRRSHRILTSLGLKEAGETWEIPSYRLDLTRPIDLVEEVARVYGLENVPSHTRATFSAASKADEAYDFMRVIQTRLSDLGFFETRNLKLISGAQLADDLSDFTSGNESGSFEKSAQ